MTNKEAAEEIQKAIDLIMQDGKDWLDERDIPILEMAINALIKETWKEEHPVSPLLQKLATTAQPERETAKFIRWMEIKKTDEYISYTPHCKCSKCGTEFLIENIKYCYMCGAEMGVAVSEWEGEE